MLDGYASSAVLAFRRRWVARRCSELIGAALRSHCHRGSLRGWPGFRPGRSLVVLFATPSSRCHAFLGGDSPNFTPQYVVADISLKLDQHRIAIPRDAFADLGDGLVPTVDVDADTRDVHIDWSGGDAAGSYRVVFTFRHYRLVQREVFAYLAKEPSEVRRFP